MGSSRRAARAASSGILRARKVRGITRLAPADLVGETERRQGVGIVGRRFQRRLELRDRGLRAGAALGDPGERTLRDRPGRLDGRRSGGGRLREDAAEKRPDEKRNRKSAAGEDASCDVSSKSPSLPVVVNGDPCGRSRCWACRRTGKDGRKPFSLLFASFPSVSWLFGVLGCTHRARSWRTGRSRRRSRGARCPSRRLPAGGRSGSRPGRPRGRRAGSGFRSSERWPCSAAAGLPAVSPVKVTEPARQLDAGQENSDEILRFVVGASGSPGRGSSSSPASSGSA